MKDAIMRAGSILSLIVLLLMLIGAGMFAYYGLTSNSDTALGVHGWTAMVLGVLFPAVVGVGLLGLLFYSSRRGYDEPPKFEKEPKSAGRSKLRTE